MKTFSSKKRSNHFIAFLIVLLLGIASLYLDFWKISFGAFITSIIYFFYCVFLWRNIVYKIVIEGDLMLLYSSNGVREILVSRCEFQCWEKNRRPKEILIVFDNGKFKKIGNKWDDFDDLYYYLKGHNMLEKWKINTNHFKDFIKEEVVPHIVIYSILLPSFFLMNYYEIGMLGQFLIISIFIVIIIVGMLIARKRLK
ncbi:MAG: hypothetical protein ACQETE_07890 [Bacteroidota bacterium]